MWGYLSPVQGYPGPGRGTPPPPAAGPGTALCTGPVTGLVVHLQKDLGPESGYPLPHRKGPEAFVPPDSHQIRTDTHRAAKAQYEYVSHRILQNLPGDGW